MLINMVCDKGNGCIFMKNKMLDLVDSFRDFLEDSGVDVKYAGRNVLEINGHSTYVLANWNLLSGGQLFQISKKFQSKDYEYVIFLVGNNIPRKYFEVEVPKLGLGDEDVLLLKRGEIVNCYVFSSEFIAKRLQKEKASKHGMVLFKVDVESGRLMTASDSKGTLIIKANFDLGGIIGKEKLQALITRLKERHVQISKICERRNIDHLRNPSLYFNEAEKRYITDTQQLIEKLRELTAHSTRGLSHAQIVGTLFMEALEYTDLYASHNSLPYCDKCKTKNPPGVVLFCVNCGEPFPLEDSECPRCRTDLFPYEEAGRYTLNWCPKCGCPLKK